MIPVRSVFRALAPVLERGVSALDQAASAFLQPRRARGKLLLQPYVGWGTPSRVEVSGRVLLPRTMRPPQTGDPRWRNFRNALRRLFSREVGGIGVTGTLDGLPARGVSDFDGYFTLTFTPTAPLSPGWHEAALCLDAREGSATARVQVVAQARFGIISDLDDTVIQSDVTSVPRMLLTVLTGNARTRSPFPGVSALYRALTHSEQERNPIFYVSSSPWNFFDLLLHFLSYRHIPLGPLFLRNWGVGLLNGHGSHKHAVIERLLTRFPELPFVLIGDSGEKDPEIYAEVVRRWPQRILGVYIRDVSEAHLDAGILALRDEVRRAGVDLVLASDSLDAASHAMSLGLISAEGYRGVLASVTRTT
ncbi:DUF2183 domain-containing protein [Deinococcus sp. KSM4-11]|uniref:App1 family protein n=1 Tax=Deinococcus sp. KSM4-11 TaxID=2568654 RepID=UPI0010A43115|nr:phosphatase domain-containing protein [Deinococcus sp. KSM4-11]THF86816.1 DUF2183 domain-containing protein [Deinococcus sp. KSM4-11]